MEVSEKFRVRFIELVREQEMTDNYKSTDAAKKMGINYNVFGKIQNYAIVPSVRNLIKIADSLNVSIEYLLAYTNDEQFIKADNPVSFHDRVDSLKGTLKYYELAKKLHIDVHYFPNWKKRKYIPSLEFLIPIARYFKVSLDYLLGRTDISEEYESKNE